METLAQSISAVAPTVTPFVSIPLIFTLVGNGTWLAYVLATGGTLLVAWCVGRFARYSSSPGSLYSYAEMILPPWLGAVAAWSLLLAYIGTSAANIAVFYRFANLMRGVAAGHLFSTLLIVGMIGGVTMWICWRDVKISARLMLLLEAVSVTSIIVVLGLVLVRHGLHIDAQQFHLRGVTVGSLRLGLVLAMFSFVGFESATALGAEARNPLRSIPRAVVLSSILAGAFFTVCAYTEVLGSRMAGQDLGTSNGPMRMLASIAGVPVLGLLIDIGVLVSLFAGTLACNTAAARVLLLMAHNGLAHNSLRATHARHETPTGAIVVTGLASLFPVALLTIRGTPAVDIYGWSGTIATYGFIVTYALVCFALPGYLRQHHGVVNAATRIIPWIGVVAMILLLAANLYPQPVGPYGKLPYVYLAYMAAALLWFPFRSRRRSTARSGT